MIFCSENRELLLAVVKSCRHRGTGLSIMYERPFTSVNRPLIFVKICVLRSGGTVDACCFSFVHNVTACLNYPVFCISHLVVVIQLVELQINTFLSLSLSLSLSNI